MDFRDAMGTTVMIIEAAGVVAIVLGTAYATIAALSRWKQDASTVYFRYRRDLGRSILIGLEFLVAADLIRTVTIDPTFENVGSLGLLILLRSVLSFAIEVEINGYWPWKRPNAATSPQDKA